MKLIDRIREHRDHLQNDHASGDVQKGSFLFWYSVLSLALQLFRLWKGK